MGWISSFVPKLFKKKFQQFINTVGRFLLFRNTLRFYYFTRFVFTLSHAPQLQGKIFVGIQKYFRVSPLQSFDLCSLSTMQWMHKLKLPNVSRSEVKGSIRITNPNNKSLLLFIVASILVRKTQQYQGKQLKGNRMHILHHKQAQPWLKTLTSTRNSCAWQC